MTVSADGDATRRGRPAGTVRFGLLVLAVLFVVFGTVESGVAGMLLSLGLIVALVGVGGLISNGRTPGVGSRRSGGIAAVVGAVMILASGPMLPPSAPRDAEPRMAAASFTVSPTAVPDSSPLDSSAAARRSEEVSSAAASSAEAAASAAALRAASSSAVASSVAAAAASSAGAVADRQAAAAAISQAALESSSAVQASLQAAGVAAVQVAAVQQAAAAPAASDGGCTVKGNISSGEKIYHVPSGQFYDRTVIDESKGERWFCSTAAAEAAGWRASLR